MKISYTLGLLWALIMSKEDTIRDEDIQTLNDYIHSKKYMDAKKLFEELFAKDKSNNVFNHEYYRFLVKIGDYKKILENKTTFLVTGETEKQLERDLEKLYYGNNKQKSELVSQSPYSISILYVAAINAIANGNRACFIKYLNMAVEVDENDIRVKKLKAQKAAIDGNYDETTLLLEEIGMREEANYLKSIRAQLNNLISMQNDRQRARGCVNLYDNISRLMLMDKFYPSIYTRLARTALENIVDTCLGNGLKGSGMYAGKLVAMDPQNISNVVKYIRILVLDESVLQAENEFEKYKGSFPENVKRFLEGQITTLKKKIEEAEAQKREQEERQKQRYEQRKRSQMGKTDNAGKDFKGYYKCLNANKDMDEKQIKKSWKKAVKKAQVKFNKTEKETGKGDDSELIKINQAKNILLDKDKKAMYDAGIDPEDKQQASNQNYQQYFDFGDGFGDFEEIVAQFFGGGNGHTTRRRIIRFG